MAASQQSASFISTLSSEIKTLQAFVEILKKEEAALMQGDIEQVDYFSSEKSRLIDQLVTCDQLRNDCMQKAGIATDKKQFDQWLEKMCTESPEIRNLWQVTLKWARMAQQLNHSNGLMVSTYLQHNQRAYSILHAASGNISLYGPKGQAYI